MNEENKDKIDSRLKHFFDEARKNGWCEGKHIFAYLSETDNMRYDNIRDTINAEKIRNKILKEIEALKTNDIFHKNYVENIMGKDDKLSRIIDSILELLKR